MHGYMKMKFHTGNVSRIFSSSSLLNFGLTRVDITLFVKSRPFLKKKNDAFKIF